MFQQIEDYIKTSARPIDKVLLEVILKKADKSLLIEELQKYQNFDGGFGHGIEPDLQAPISTPISTSVALQYFIVANLEDDELLKSTLSYLLDSSYDHSFQGWFRINKEINDFPHAPWWEFDSNKQKQHWANPTVEITAYLNKFSKYLSAKQTLLLDELNQMAQNYLQSNSINEVHDLLCYKRYYELSPKLFGTEAKKRLFDFIGNVVEKDSSKWDGYVPKPLDFIDSPNSPFTSIFSDKLIRENMEFLKKSIMRDHWEPTWTWGDDSREWERAKIEWSGVLTVKNLLILEEFQIDE